MDDLVDVHEMLDVKAENDKRIRDWGNREK
jgi:hypothetical protein